MEVSQGKTSSGRNNNASEGVDENVWKVHAVTKKNALEKNRAKRRREVSLPSNSLFVCSSL
jgi:hypothetical protein